MRARGETDRRARRGIQPYPSVGGGRGGGGFAGSRRRRGRRRRGHHHRDHHAKAVTLVQVAWPEELQKRLTVANGRAGELLPGGEPSPAELGCGEGLTGSDEVVRCRCVRKKGEGWSGGASSPEQCTPESIGQTLASNFFGERAYHDAPKRATGA
jgi:hypothetical protein